MANEDLMLLVDRKIAAALKEVQCGSCSTGANPYATTRRTCGIETRLSQMQIRRALRQRTGNARYAGPPLTPTNTVEFVVPAFILGWRMGPFNFEVDMAANGIAQDIVVRMYQAEDLLHEFSADEYSQYSCCALLSRDIEDCLGYTSEIVIRMTHNGAAGDPDLVRARINYERVFENDTLWRNPPPFEKANKDMLQAWVASVCNREAQRALAAGE